jgi:hypothetical protein
MTKLRSVIVFIIVITVLAGTVTILAVMAKVYSQKQTTSTPTTMPRPAPTNTPAPTPANTPTPPPTNTLTPIHSNTPTPTPTTTVYPTSLAPASPAPTSAPTSSPTLTSTLPQSPTATVAHWATEPELEPPANGHTYRTVTFQWRGALRAGQAYQVTAYHSESGYTIRSNLLTDQSWIPDLSNKVGDWRWAVSVVQGGRAMSTSPEWMFWFNPYPSPTEVIHK